MFDSIKNWFQKDFWSFIKANSVWVAIIALGLLIAIPAIEELKLLAYTLMLFGVAQVLYNLSLIMIFNLKPIKRMFTDSDGKIDSDMEKLAGGIITAVVYLACMLFVAICTLSIYICQFADTVTK